MEKRLQIGDKTYTFVATRSVIKSLYNVCPEMFNTKGKSQNDVQDGIKLAADFGEIFYELIKVKHPEISKEKSLEILSQADREYGLIEITALFNEFITSVFTNDNQPKKKAVWLS